MFGQSVTKRFKAFAAHPWVAQGGNDDDLPPFQVTSGFGRKV
jgi:hypothetical protein